MVENQFGPPSLPDDSLNSSSEAGTQLCRQTHDYSHLQIDDDEKIREAFLHAIAQIHLTKAGAIGGFPLDESLAQNLSIDFFQKAGLLRTMLTKSRGNINTLIDYLWPEGFPKTEHEIEKSQGEERPQPTQIELRRPIPDIPVGKTADNKDSLLTTIRSKFFGGQNSPKNNINKLKEEPEDSTAASSNGQKDSPDCRHHWIIESPHGPTSMGKCVFCSEERQFSNVAADTVWEGDPMVTIDRMANGRRLSLSTSDLIRDEE